MRIFVIGANGQLGWELCRQGKESSADVVGCDLPEVDITDPAALERAVKGAQASVVINAAAYTAVDRAESEPELAFAVNRDGPAVLAALCREMGIPLVHISTDYVFDGEKGSPYLETDPVSPLGVYGRSKAAGEEEIRAGLDRHIIVRTSWLYGMHGNNFVKTILRLAGEKETLRVVADQFGSPTHAADLAGALLDIAVKLSPGDRGKWGTYHYCNEGVTTWHGFAEKICGLLGEKEDLTVRRVEPIPTSQYPTAAKRPHYSALDCSMLFRDYGIRPRAWEQSLMDMLEIRTKIEPL
ncbi:MAG: dTDP-4-dehydrorhamnose reductase [Desulfatiglandales bacterium]